MNGYVWERFQHEVLPHLRARVVVDVAGRGQRFPEQFEERELDAVRQKIQKASENLALVENPDDSAAVSRVVDKWREEESELCRRIQDRANQLDMLPS